MHRLKGKYGSIPLIMALWLELPLLLKASASAIFNVSVVSSPAFPSPFTAFSCVENSLNMQGRNNTILATPVRALTYL